MSNRKHYLDYLRVLASAAVVMIHTSTTNWYVLSTKNLEWQISNFYNSISRWSVPIFFMISGALFLKKDISINDIFVKYVKRLLIIFYFWSLVYFIYYLFFNNDLSKALNCLFFGNFHQWYLLVSICLYIFTPILRKIVNDKQICKYFLKIVFIFSFAIASLKEILNVFGYISINVFFDDLCLTEIPYCFGYYVLGYYLDNYEIKNKTILYILGFFGLFITIVGTSIFSISFDNATSVLYEYNMPNVCFTAIALFIFFKNKHLYKYNKLLERWSKYTLCIYLVHPLVKNILKAYCIDKLVSSPLLEMPLFFFEIYVLSLILSVCLNNIPILKKYIV